MKDSRLNVEKALKKLGGSHKLYKILLVGFSLKYAKVDQEIRTFSMEGSFDEAQRLAHSIKGLSGNLGAEKLRICALKLEDIYKNDPIHYEATLNSFSLELSEVVKEVKYRLEEYKEATSEAAPVLEEIDGSDVGVIHHLVEALESFEYGRIRDARASFKNYNFTEEAQVIAGEINELIDLYDYNEARIQIDVLLDFINKK
ncbi:MAG: hypothetical protein CVU84_05800 [Firmicutes bacterium HGW-Firmicutes-1]|jgi:HPt (histidine-containing phosphotransfer) domain-containing protein|nr:MAG: hypothetical protein CVU84_05800 [Firmicutes bacterium HGW-Firmicutes-1]